MFSRERDPAPPSSPYKLPTPACTPRPSPLTASVVAVFIPGAAALLPPLLLLPLALMDEGVREEDGLHGLCPAPPRAMGEPGLQRRSRAQRRSPLIVRGSLLELRR